MRRLLGLAIVLALLILPAWTALADHGDPLTPERPSKLPAYTDPQGPLYDDPRYPPWAYTFEGDLFHNSVYTQHYLRLNQMLVLKAWLLKLAIRSAEYAMSSDFFQPFVSQAGDALTAFGEQFWETEGAPLVTGALALSGIWALALYLTGRAGRTWGAMGGSVLVLMLSGLIMTSGAEFASSAVSLARSVAQQSFGAIEAVAPTGASADGLIVTSGVAAWNTLVYEPWVTGEFGSDEGRAVFRADGSTVDGSMMLEREQWERLFDPYCQSSTRTVQRRYCPWWQVEFLPRRLMLAGWTLVATIAYGGTVLALAGGMIAAQLSILLLLALAPLWLLVALWWPQAGVRLLRSILGKFLGALVAQAMLAGTLGVLLLLTLSVTQTFDSFGWMFESTLLAGLGALAFRYRYAWLTPFVGLARRREQVEIGTLGRVRGWLGGERRPVATDGAPSGERSTAEPVPSFATMQPTLAAVESVTVAEQRVEPERGDQPMMRPQPREIVYGQLQLLREQLNVREEWIRHDRTDREREATAVTWEEPAPAPGRTGAASAERAHWRPLRPSPLNRGNDSQANRPE